MSRAPGVLIREIDLTGSVPAVGTSAGATVGDFTWGAAYQRVRVSDDNELAATFGKPTDRNYVSWLSAKSFLAYTGMLYIVRVVDSTAKNATGDGAGLLIKNQQEFNAVNDDIGTHAAKLFAARYAGALGNSIAISIADAKNFKKWEYADEFDAAPATSEHAASVGAKYDEVHVVVIDKLGLFTGVVGTILETYPFLSKARDAKGLDGAPIYYAAVLNEQSKYVYFFGHPITANYHDNTGDYTDATDAWGSKLVVNGEAKKFKVLKKQDDDNHHGYYTKLEGGNDGGIPDAQEIIQGWNEFKSTEEIDVGILITGNAGGKTSHKTVCQHVIDNICERRKDCVVTISPQLEDVLNKTQSDATDKIVATRNGLNRSSNYAIFDSGWKMMYDVHNDKYRWVPLNGDIAGLMALTENQYDAWWSPAGYNRGKLRNVVSLAFNPSEDSRTVLYKNQVNSVVTFTNDGTILYGDKTMQAKTSAFQYINVRRLFITLEKAIGKASKYQLFEFNDEITRNTFRNMVEPYLREVQGRRGIYSYRVVCDSSNNTPEVIDRGEFVGSIFIKPSRSIQTIILNFVAVRTGVEFSEVIGKSY